MSKDEMVVSYVKEITVHKVHLADFPHEEFEKAGYIVVKLNCGLYGIVKDGILKETFVKFDKPKELEIFREDIYLIHLENGLQKIMLVEPKGKVVFSEAFKEIKKVFKKYILVEFESGKRALTDGWSDLEFFEWENGMTSSKYGNSTNHAILELQNGKYAILTKDGLNYNGLEFESVHDYFDVKTNDSFRRVIVEKGREVLVRISDLRVSEVYYNIYYYSYGYGLYSQKYVKVHKKNSRTDAILRISDFEVSKEYENLLGIDSDFAVFEENGQRNILRLTDFKEAKWEDE